jgi:hypothetical protein
MFSRNQQHEFGDKLCFFSVDKLYIKNILTLLKKYVFGLGNIQQHKNGKKWVEKLLVTFKLIFILCGNKFLVPERKKPHISLFAIFNTFSNRHNQHGCEDIFYIVSSNDFRW